jgi:hypothetical protein
MDRFGELIRDVINALGFLLTQGSNSVVMISGRRSWQLWRLGNVLHDVPRRRVRNSNPYAVNGGSGRAAQIA